MDMDCKGCKLACHPVNLESLEGVLCCSALQRHLQCLQMLKTFLLAACSCTEGAVTFLQRGGWICAAGQRSQH